MGGVDGGSVVEEGGKVYYRASALGSCPRALAAARQGMEAWDGPNPEKIQAVFDRGHDAEDQVVAALEADKFEIRDRQRMVELKVTGKISVRGHIDFFMQGTEAEYGVLVDVKRQNDEEWAKESIRQSMWWPHYEWQLPSYMHALDEDGIAVIRVNDAGERKLEYLLREELHSVAEIRGLVLGIEALATTDARELECSESDYPCPYFKLHKGSEVREVEDEELGYAAKLYSDMVARDKIVKAEREKWRGILVDKVGTGKVREVGSGIVISVTKSNYLERTIPPGIMTRVNVRLPKSEGDGEDG